MVRRDSALILRLHEREIQVLQWVFADLGRVLAEGSDADSVTQRLFPRAYLDPTEESAESEWQSGSHADLVETRRSALQAVGLDLDSAEPATGRDAMREVGRPGTSRAVARHPQRRAARARDRPRLTAETDVDALEPDDPRFEPYVVYDWLTHLLGALLGSVASPPPTRKTPRTAETAESGAGRGLA